MRNAILVAVVLALQFCSSSLLGQPPSNRIKFVPNNSNLIVQGQVQILKWIKEAGLVGRMPAQAKELKVGDGETVQLPAGQVLQLRKMTLGRGAKIVCQGSLVMKVSEFEGASGSVIDVSGLPGEPAKDNSDLTGTPESEAPGGGNADWNDDAENGDTGYQGGRGGQGHNGHDGGDGGYFTMIVDVFKGGTDFLARGGKGSDGGMGGKGGKGGRGGDGGDAYCSHPAANGGQGGQGGEGGKGGNGGNGGKGGLIQIFYKTDASSANPWHAYADSGQPGVGGPGGPGGEGGDGGMYGGGRCDHGEGNTGDMGRSGPRGPDGEPGKKGQPGTVIFEKS